MLEIIKLFVRRMLMGKGKGILQITSKKQVDKFAEDLHKTFKKHGIPDNAVNNPNDVKVIWNQITNKESQVLSTTLDDILKGPVTVSGPKGKRTWDFSKKQKKGDVVDLFASEKEFGDDLYSIGQNFIKNDPMFNLELATTFRNPGTKIYSAHGTGKLHSPSQRQKILDNLKKVMKHDTYQAQHGEELGFVDLTDDIFTIEKASGGRVPFFKGKIAKGILSLGKKKKFRPSLEQRRHNARLMGEEIKPTKKELEYEKLLREKATESFYKNWGIDRKTGLKIEKASGGRIGRYGGGIAPLVGEPSYSADFYDDRTPMKEGKKAKKKKKKKKAVPEELPPFQGPDYETDIPKEATKEIIRRYIGSGVMGVPIGGEFEYGLGYGEDKPFDYGIGYNVGEGDSGLYADYGIRTDDENVYSGGYKGDNWNIGVSKEEGGEPQWKFELIKKFNQGGRIGMLAGGSALKKFIEKLFIKASNDIRLGRGKWKGLDQKQIAVQHDNLTKKVIEFQKSGKTVGLEEYFGVDPHTAFIAARDKVKRQGIIKDVPDYKKGEVEAQRQEQIMEEAYDEIAGGSGFSGDYKYDADILADSIAEVQGKVYADLPDLERTGIYDQALKRVTKNLKAKMDFKKNLKDVEQKIELQMFDPKDRLPNQSGGSVNQEALIQMYLEEGLSYDEAVAAAQATSGLDMDISKDEKAKGGRAGYIFGGSAGLKAMWKNMLKGLSKGRDKPVKRLFPTLSAREREMEKLVMGTPEQKAFREGEVTHKIEGIDLLINRMKHDKKIIERQAKNKAMKDEGLDFLMKHLEETVMPDIYGPHLKKYTNIDKDILQMENIKKNLIMKDRKLNAEGGRIGYAGGGKTGLPAVTMGTPQMNMQQPQMPAGPQPAGIPGGTIVAQNQMQQSPWMGSQMQQGIGGMPQRGQPRPGGMPGPGGMPRPMAAEGGIMRMPFGLGSMSRRAFLKMMAAVGALPFMAKGISKVAPKAIPKVTETIARGADGMPAYLTDLIEVVKAKGTKDFIEGFKRSDYSTVHRYKNVEVIEDAGGRIRVKSDKTGVATDPYTGKTHEGIAQENHIQIEKGEWIEPTKTKKGIKTKDEYIEGTVYPDMDGKMKDWQDGLDEAIHLDFKKIADEVDTLVIKKSKKASGGLAYALGE